MSVFWFGLEYRTIQVNGQRFIGPPIACSKPEPTYDWELFVKHLPRNFYEQELVPLFSAAGFVYQIRLLMCFSGLNRGIAYVRFTNETDFRRAVLLFNNLPIAPRFVLYAGKSLNLRKLVLLNIEQSIEDGTIRKFIDAICSGVCYHVPVSSGDRLFAKSHIIVMIMVAHSNRPTQDGAAWYFTLSLALRNEKSPDGARSPPREDE
ncbi:probable RNA-binding protein 46 [Wyeomyia smithii]|uniref:probable RNA-binding protein 46 n=1 Tax=Wyeomyia smithii TaxID=174621 RepID=UPI002467DF70|nr:probable RNA-binding protein 46 [Wyeomyia smithii]